MLSLPRLLPRLTVSACYRCRGAYRGSLSVEELDALDKAAMEKNAAIQLLVAREQDLRMIRDTSQPLTKQVST